MRCFHFKLNPLNEWFAVRRFGFGIAPNTWEGWLLLMSVVGFIAVIVIWSEPIYRPLVLR